MALNSKPAPVVGGVQWLGRSPIGTKMAPNRLVGVAAVRAVRVRAGTMASSSGSDSVAPMPRSTVRRDTEDLVMNMTAPLFELYRQLRLRTRGLHTLLERDAPHHA